MRMKIITGLVMAVAFGAVAHATEFVTNGNFEATTGASGSSFEYDPAQPSSDHGVVTGWSVVNPAGQTSYDILFRTASATTTDAITRFSEAGQRLWALPSNTGTSNIGNNFMALDGAYQSDNKVQGEIQQQITGLTAGQTYTLTFDFAAAQLRDRSGDTTEQLQVSLGSQTFLTDVLNNSSHSATPWELETFTFTATSSSELLRFLSIGTPNGEPPMALLDNVSLTNTVPEPATWGLMLVGVAAIGASLRMRRRTADVVA
jgi:hypothetical protein